MDLDRSRQLIGGDWCKELAPGGPYFTVSYQKGGVNLPEVETLVYLGLMRPDDDVAEPKAHFLFQLTCSYQHDGDWTELPEERRTELAADAKVMLYDEGSVRSIADIDGLLVLLTDFREHMRLGLGWDHALPNEP